MTKQAASTKSRITDEWQAYPNAVLYSVHWQKNYPLQYLSARAHKRLSEIGKRVCTEYDITVHRLVFRILEAFLAVTNQRIDFRRGKFTSPNVMIEFLGALYSERLVVATHSTRNKWARSWRLMLRDALPDLEVGIPPVKSRAYPIWCNGASRRFDVATLEPVQVELWRGWGMVNRSGMTRWYDFRNLYLRYGREFVARLVHGCTLFRKNREDEHLPLMQEFSDFLSMLSEDWTIEPFSSASQMSTLMGRFLRVQAEEADKQNMLYRLFRTQWTEFTWLFSKFLCRPGLFARGTAVPFLPGPGGDQSQTHRKVTPDGSIVIVKLLTDVHLHISNQAATELVFVKVSADIDAVRAWAENEVEKTWARCRRRKELAKKGVAAIRGSYTSQDREALSRDDENWEANACATFERYGFLPRRDGHVASLYPSPLEDVARETLGLPTTGCLIPHMALLVIEHPELTAGFFKSLELFDPSGQLSGLGETDIGWMVDGDKVRKGRYTFLQETRSWLPKLLC
jgi:hypothetical protein